MLLFSLSIGSTTPYYNLVISKIKKIFGNVDDQVICIIADIIYRGEQLYKAQQSLYIISCIILSFLGWDWLLTWTFCIAMKCLLSQISSAPNKFLISQN